MEGEALGRGRSDDATASTFLPAVDMCRRKAGAYCRAARRMLPIGSVAAYAARRMTAMIRASRIWSAQGCPSSLEDRGG